MGTSHDTGGGPPFCAYARSGSGHPKPETTTESSSGATAAGMVPPGAKTEAGGSVAGRLARLEAGRVGF